MSVQTHNQELLSTILRALTATKPRVDTSLFISTRQICITLMVLLFMINMVLAPWGTAYAAGTAVKWHPGHYYGILTAKKNDARYLNMVYDELKETPALRGIIIRYRWVELEPKKGDYDFTSIDQRLAELSAQQGKRLIIMVETKTFDPEFALVPNYLKAGKYDGGIFPYHSHGESKNIINGYNIKLWNNNVRHRLTELIKALGEHYNAHPKFEGIGLGETAMGQPINAISSNQVDKFYENLINVNVAMSTHFPNTMTFQNLNFPHRIMESFVSQLSEMGAALAVPDVRPDDPILGRDEPNRPKGIYTYYPTHSGVMPLILQVEHNNYLNTRRDGSGHKPTIPELLRFARDDLKANYIFWVRIANNHDEVLEVLNWRKQTSNPAGGLGRACPAVYSSCDR